MVLVCTFAVAGELEPRFTPTSVSNDGTRFIFQTDKDAPRQRLVSFDITDTFFTLTEVLAEDPEALILDAYVVADNHLMVRKSRNVKDELYIYQLIGDKAQLIGRVAPDWSGQFSIEKPRWRDQKWFTAMLTGFTSPGIAMMYDFRKPLEQRWMKIREHAIEGLKADEFLTEQVCRKLYSNHFFR